MKMKETQFFKCQPRVNEKTRNQKMLLAKS